MNVASPAGQRETRQKPGRRASGIGAKVDHGAVALHPATKPVVEKLLLGRQHGWHTRRRAKIGPGYRNPMPGGELCHDVCCCLHRVLLGPKTRERALS